MADRTGRWLQIEIWVPREEGDEELAMNAINTVTLAAIDAFEGHDVEVSGAMETDPPYWASA